MTERTTLFRTIALGLALLSASASGASAFDVSGQSRTYLQSRETADSSRLLPLFEYLNFETGSSSSKNVTFKFGGWYRFDLQDESFGGTKHTGDLQYAYVSYRAGTSNAFANLGRVVVSQGVAFEQVDGLSAGADLRAGFGVSAFGGIPVETDVDSRNGDSVYGGRLSQGRDGLYRIGVSYLKEKNDSKDFREEEGVDLWLRPVDRAELLGFLLYNAITSEKAQTSLNLTLGPFRNVVLRTQYMDVSYRDYFTGTTTSAFLTGPGGSPLDLNEQLTLIGEEATVSWGKAAITADYRKYDYDIAGSANAFGATASYTGEKNSGGGLGYHRMDGESRDLQYSEYRVYAFRSFGKIDVTADALLIDYDAAINGVNTAYNVALAGDYALSARARIGGDVEYAKNPYYDREVTALLKFVYNFDLAFAGKTASASGSRRAGKRRK